MLGKAASSAGSGFSLKLVHEIDDIEEAAAGAIADGRVTSLSDIKAQ